MGKIIAVTMQKGGVGKSTTSQALSCILGSRGYKTLLVDLDAQRNSTQSSGVTDPKYTITDV